MTSKRATATGAAAAAATGGRLTVDLGKLRKTSLKRYKKHFKLDCKADSKPDLVEAVRLHFEGMPVRESDVAMRFHHFARTLRGRRIIAGDATHTQHQSPGPAAACAAAAAAAALASASAHDAAR